MLPKSSTTSEGLFLAILTQSSNVFVLSFIEIFLFLFTIILPASILPKPLCIADLKFSFQESLIRESTLFELLSNKNLPPCFVIDCIKNFLLAWSNCKITLLIILTCWLVLPSQVSVSIPSLSTRNCKSGLTFARPFNSSSINLGSVLDSSLYKKAIVDPKSVSLRNPLLLYKKFPFLSTAGKVAINSLTGSGRVALGSISDCARSYPLPDLSFSSTTTSSKMFNLNLSKNFL